MICPIMTQGWLANKYCYIEDEKEYLISCKKENCGCWVGNKMQGHCGLTNREKK